MIENEYVKISINIDFARLKEFKQNVIRSNIVFNGNKYFDYLPYSKKKKTFTMHHGETKKRIGVVFNSNL